MSTIFDTPDPVTSVLPRLTSTTAIIRYLNSVGPRTRKVVQLAEAQAIAAAGKQLALVHEAWGDFAHSGRGGISAADGARDGPYAYKVASALGAPDGAAVYFAVDTDATPAQIRSYVLPYFQQIKQAFSGGLYRIGVYGCGAVCEAVIGAGLADLGWLSCSKGWTGYASFLSKAALVQSVPTHLSGLDIDPDTAQVADWGQFVPFSADPVTAAVTDDEADEVHHAGSPTMLDSSAISNSSTPLAEMVPPVLKSKVAWLSGMLGGGGALSSITSDPHFSITLEAVVDKPAFWFAVGAIVLAAALVYFHWRDGTSPHSFS